jgi:hypothetical protein
MATMPGPGVTNMTTPAAVTVDPVTATATLRTKPDSGFTVSLLPLLSCVIVATLRQLSMYQVGK